MQGFYQKINISYRLKKDKEAGISYKIRNKV